MLLPFSSNILGRKPDVRLAKERNDAVIQGDVVAIALRRFADKLDAPWEGTPTELYEAIERMYDHKPPRGLPRAVNTFSRRTNELVRGLDAEGVEIQWSKDVAGKRGKRFRIQKKNQQSQCADTDPLHQPAANDRIMEPTQPTHPIELASANNNPGVGTSESEHEIQSAPPASTEVNLGIATNEDSTKEPTQDEPQLEDQSDGTFPLPVRASLNWRTDPKRRTQRYK